MEFIDRNITQHNIHENILLLKELVRDLETDMNEQDNIKPRWIYINPYFPLE